MAGISLKNIWKTYKVNEQNICVLNGINLKIPEEKITVVLGKSGCGKTTLLRIVGGLEEADAGEIVHTGMQKMGFVFQEARLMPWLNVWNNVRFGLIKEEADDRMIQKTIDKVGLSGFEKAYPHQLSGGMQQRVAIARALVYEPSFIMMDEPFAALDHFTRIQMQKELLKMQKECGTSLLFVTHNIDEALLLGNKIIIVESGKVKAEFLIETENEMRDLLDPELILQKKKIIEQLDL